jgi:hypothetical protein
VDVAAIFATVLASVVAALALAAIVYAIEQIGRSKDLQARRSSCG